MDAGDNYMRLMQRYDQNQRLNDLEYTALINHTENIRKQLVEVLKLPEIPQHVECTRVELENKVQTAIMVKNNVYKQAVLSNPDFKLNVNREGGQAGTYKYLTSHAQVFFVLSPFRVVLPPFR